MKEKLFQILITKENTTKPNHPKRIKILNGIIILSFLISLWFSLFSIKYHLIYSVPVIIISIALKYIILSTHKLNPFFILGLIFTFISDILIFDNFQKYYTYISISTILCIISYILMAKSYLHKGKLKSILSTSAFLSLGLILYVLVSLLKVLSFELPDLHLILTIIATVSFIIYFISAGIIYLKGIYHNGVVLLISVISYFFQLIFSIINEFVFFERTLTTLILICHIGSIWLLMKFLLDARVIENNMIDN
ncbi:hypothetical protein LG651_09370 [Tamlana sp. 62-3]|uniref:Uncharacterized protein n=1 Tax=Neotamlana sargassicola TaxID=2883125 RepID=A0A9X1L4R0_9FLAO|nr:hypothetical protein [Tamlana sargassicola]MCB4808462.1 hypothetical protein [Tamlana sargassicola]